MISPAIRSSVVATALFRWRTLFDRALVLVLIVVLWQAGSMWFGAYWLSSPWATTTRFVEQILMASAPARRLHAGRGRRRHTGWRTVAVLLPFWLRRHPSSWRSSTRS